MLLATLLQAPCSNCSGQQTNTFENHINRTLTGLGTELSVYECLKRTREHAHTETRESNANDLPLHTHTHVAARLPFAPLVSQQQPQQQQLRAASSLCFSLGAPQSVRDPCPVNTHSNIFGVRARLLSRFLPVAVAYVFSASTGFVLFFLYRDRANAICVVTGLI